jgi:hypothetical protein
LEFVDVHPLKAADESKDVSEVHVPSRRTVDEMEQTREKFIHLKLKDGDWILFLQLTEGKSPMQHSRQSVLQ